MVRHSSRKAVRASGVCQPFQAEWPSMLAADKLGSPAVPLALFMVWAPLKN